MSDVFVTSELTLDIDPLRESLRRALADMEAWALQANAIKVGPTAMFDVNAMRTQWDQWIQSLAPIPVKLDLTPAQAQWNSWVASLGGVGININVTNTATIGQGIANAMTTQLQAAAATIGAQIGQQISANIQGGGGGGGGGGGIPGGRSGGGGHSRMYGFGRLLMPLMAIHQAVREYEIGEQYETHLLDSGGNYEKMVQADIRRKKEQDSLLMGGGRLMRSIRENTYGPMMGEDTLEQQEQQVRDMKENDRRRLEGKADLSADRRSRIELAEALAPDNRRRIEARWAGERQEGVAALDETRDKKLKEAGERYTAAMTRADILEHTASRNAGDELGSGEYAYSTLHKRQAEDIRRRAASMYEYESGNARNKRDELVSRKLETLNENERRQREDFDMQDQQAQIKSESSIMRGSGRDIDAQRLEYRGRLMEERFRAGRESKAQLEAFERSYGARVSIEESKIGVEQLRSSQEVGDIGADAATAMRKASGSETSQNREDEYARKLRERIDLTKALGQTSEEAAAKARALDAAFSTQVAAFHMVQAQHDAARAGANLDKIADIKASTQEGWQRAYGDTRGSTRSEMGRQIDDQVKALYRRADQAGSPAERQELIAQAEAIRDSKFGKLGAYDQANARQDEREMRSIEQGAYLNQMQLGGRGGQAAMDKIDFAYDEKIRAAQEKFASSPEQATKVTSALREERDSSKALIQKQQDRELADIRESTTEKRMRREGRGVDADVMALQSRYAKEIEAASDDPTKQRALYMEEEEELKGMRQGRALTGSSEDIWKGLITRQSTKSIDDALAKTGSDRRDLEAGIGPDGKPIPRGPKKPGDGHMGDQPFAPAADALNNGAMLLGKAAQKIIDSQPLFIAGVA